MKKLGYIVIRQDSDGRNQIVKNQVFELRETAEFLRDGSKMVQRKNDDDHIFISEVEFVQDDVNNYLKRIR